MRPMRRGELAAREAVHRDPETGVQLRRRGHSLTLVESSPLRSAGGKRVCAHVDCHGSGCLHGTPIRSGSIARQVDETATVTALAMSLGPGEVLGSKLGQMRCVRHTSSFDAGTWDRGWVEVEVSSLGQTLKQQGTCPGTLCVYGGSLLPESCHVQMDTGGSPCR